MREQIVNESLTSTARTCRLFLSLFSPRHDDFTSLTDSSASQFNIHIGKFSLSQENDKERRKRVFFPHL